MQFISESLNDLYLPAQALKKQLDKHRIFVFKGEMGAGKTTFIKAFCKELGIIDDVSSPTFSLVNEYRTADNKSVFHFDFYRINAEQEALDMGIYEYLDTGICLIEWGEKIAGILNQEPHLRVQINEENSKRFITFDESPT